MEHVKKTVILKGAAEGSFVMQKSAATRYALIWNADPVEGDIFVFDDAGAYRLTGRGGTLPIDISAVRAIAIGEDFCVKGQLKPFNWARARMLISREQGEPEQSNEDTPKDTRALVDVNDSLKLELPAQLMDDPRINSAIELIKDKLRENTVQEDELSNNREKRKKREEPTEPAEQPAQEEAHQEEQSEQDEQKVQEVREKQEKQEKQENQKKQGKPDEPKICEDSEGAYACPVGRFELDNSPFGAIYPHSKWYRHEYPSARGRWHYLTGELSDERGRVYATVIALPGTPNMRPSGGGYSSFRRSSDGTGYWMKINRA